MTDDTTENAWTAEAAGEAQGSCGATLLTRSDTGPDAGSAPGPEAPQDGSELSAPDDAVPDSPEGYTLRFVQGVTVDRGLLSEFQRMAHESGMRLGDAQKLASLYAAHAGKSGEAAARAQAQAIENARVAWENEIRSSPAFAREKVYAQTALRKYGDNELYALMDQTNLGSHPKMWAFLSRVGKALSEPGFHGGPSSRDVRSAADIMYPQQGRQR